MARLFPGGTATDVITTTAYTSDANTSIALWVLRTGSGGGSLGRFVAKGTATIADYSLFVNGAVLQFEADFTTTDGRWTVPWGTGNDNAWRHVVVTYNNSAVANNPSIYINGVAQTVTRAQAPVGVFNASASGWFIGNNTTGVRVFQGRIAEFAAWAKILTATDARTLASGFSPLFLVGGTRAIVPLIDATTNYRGAPNTVTGTTSAPHLNILTPVTNHSFYGSAPPPTANANVANYPLPLTISPATTRVTSLLALPSLATTIEVGDITTSVLARPSAVLLPLSVGAISATTKLNVASTSVPLSIGAINALGTAKPQSTTLGLSISAISSRSNATVPSTSLPLTIGAISAVATTPVKASYFVNCAGGAYTDVYGRQWEAENYATALGGGSTTNSTAATIANTPDQTLYRTYREGDFRYDFPVINDTYRVTLHFIEPIWESANVRLFSLASEATRIFTDLDVWTNAGGKNRAYQYSFDRPVTDGSLGLLWLYGTSNPLVSAIQIEPRATAKDPILVGATEIGLSIGAISAVEVGGTVSATPPNIPLPLTLGAINTKTTALVRSPSLALQIEVEDITLATTARITPGFVSLPIAISPISTRTTALARTSAILLPLTVSSVVARGEGAITPPATLLPLTISAIATSATAKTTIPNISIGLLVSGASTKTTAFALPGVAFIGLTVSAIGTKTTAYLLPPSISLPLTVWEIKSYSIGVVPVTYGGRSNVTLRNRIINIETVAGKTQVENIGGRTDVGKGGETDIESEVVW